MFKWKRGSLFWKLLLGLWFSLILTVLGTSAYFHAAGLKPPKKDSSARIAGIPAIPLVPLASAGIAILFTGFVLVVYVTRPLQHFRWALAQIAAGKLETRVRPLMGRRKDEIAELAYDFDRMASQLQQLTDSRNVLLHDVSHELRSPLTRIQAAIGLMRQDPLQSEMMISRITRESERLDALIEELLTLHRLEAGAGRTNLRRVDIVELLQAIAEDADFEARTHGRSVSIKTPPRFIASVNGELIYRAFENVIRNAIKFTPVGSQVEILSRLTDDGEYLETVVSDRGPGVPDDMLDSIFKPFARVEQTGGEVTAYGTGLGLAIAKRALEAHGGRITASARQGGGLQITLTLPVTS